MNDIIVGGVVVVVIVKCRTVVQSLRVVNYQQKYRNGTMQFVPLPSQSSKQTNDEFGMIFIIVLHLMCSRLLIFCFQSLIEYNQRVVM